MRGGRKEQCVYAGIGRRDRGASEADVVGRGGERERGKVFRGGERAQPSGGRVIGDEA